MAYVDVNTPVIDKIKLPSGNDYYIADRELRDVVDILSDTVAGGVSYNVAWDGASTPVVANIPAGVTVKYNNQTYTGTLDANDASPGAFYLVKSSTLPSGETLDIYEEYVPVGSAGSKTWEKIGDTKIDLSDVVTGVSLTKQTDTAIGTDATFKITQPTISLATGATAGTGVVSVATGISSVTQPTVALSEEASTATGRVAYTKSVSTTKLSATASISGKTGSAASSVTPTTKKLATTTVTGVSGSTNITPVESRSSQTTAKGTGTASTTNTDWIKGMSVSNGVLSFGAAKLDTQTTYSAGAPRASLAVPTAASSATTVATGATTTTGSGADIVTDVAVGDTVTVVTAAPTITIASGTSGDVTVATGGTTKYMAAAASGTAVTPSTTNIKATASGANTAWNSKDSVTVLKDTTDVSVTKGS